MKVRLKANRKAHTYDVYRCNVLVGTVRWTKRRRGELVDHTDGSRHPVLKTETLVELRAALKAHFQNRRPR